MLDEEDNERLAEDLMDYWHSLEQFDDMMTMEADGAMEPCDFYSHSLCMFAGYAEDDVVTCLLNEFPLSLHLPILLNITTMCLPSVRLESDPSCCLHKYFNA